MPEGDTVHRLAALLTPLLEGQVLTGGAVRELPERRLAGRRVESVTARGKHLFVAFDDGFVLRSHLGMHGSWHSYLPGEPWRRAHRQASLWLETAARVFVCFNAAAVESWRGAGLRQRAFDATLGPDLLVPPVAFDAILERARTLLAPDSPLVDLLLDQRIAAGIGNVYKSEVLFIERWHPECPIAGLADDALLALYRRAAGLLSANLAGARRTTRWIDGQPAGLWVYRRARRACRCCATPIRAAALGQHQRLTCWCPHCQPAWRR